MKARMRGHNDSRLSPLPAMLLAALQIGCSGSSEPAGSGEALPPVAPAPPVTPPIALIPAFPNLAFDQPVGMFQAPTDASRWYLVEKSGRIFVFDNDSTATNASLFADLRSRVNAAGEGGLLGMALHPDYENNRAVFLSYTAGDFESRLAHYQANPDGLTLDENSETLLLTLDQPFSNHNGGHLAFGPGPASGSQYLYMGFGDGGGAGDPGNRAQNPFDFHGSLLRIDVSPLTGYSIPPDNPFANGMAAQPETFAFGFRNPWRFSFDRADGSLWLADVGQNSFEEVDIVTAGGNYGWRCYEGDATFDAAGCPGADQLEFPVAAYGHSSGSASVTGGFVYRGPAITGLQGVYIFGDFVTGTIRGLFPDGVNPLRMEVLLESGLNIVSFAEGLSGELYVIDFSGSVYRVVSGN